MLPMNGSTGSFSGCCFVFQLNEPLDCSYNMMPGPLFEKFVKCEFGLMTAMSYPDTDATRLRITADYMSILFAYDDLMDLPSSDLMHDKLSSTKAAKIMMQVLTHPQKFKPVPGLPVATAFHEYVKPLALPRLPLNIYR